MDHVLGEGLAPVPEAHDDVVRQLGTLDTCSVSDAMDRLDIPGQCFGIRPLAAGMRVVGRAFTVRYVPVGQDRGTVGDYIDDLDPGTVVVLDNAGRLDATVWGDLLTMVASRKGLAGTVIDGVCRDSDIAIEAAYPIFSRSHWMRTGKDRVRVDGYQLPVSVGGVRVDPGDLLFGDNDGLISVPAARAAEVVDVATAIRDAEAKIRDDVMAGLGLSDARARAGYHALQTRMKP